MKGARKKGEKLAGPRLRIAHCALILASDSSRRAGQVQGDEMTPTPGLITVIIRSCLAKSEGIPASPERRFRGRSA